MPVRKKEEPKKYYKFHLNFSNLPDELFVKAEDQRMAIFAAYMVLEDFVDGDVTEISAEEYASADDDYKDGVLG